ncbi:hypothetical protein XA68_15640 [Ophiocordyceps unilateralis]|uniref:Uncharacterized protein n=1 Tax=Ophiocordyceps unilateralis TaxID=268505 RepID=A0A2A9PKT2_OPHUN|nr:hypothetical protein XA68_15640 [Ophiocordyceps unilateralis]
MASVESPSAITPDEITRADFDSLLAQYPALLEDVSLAKGQGKPGTKTLNELDKYRYIDAPQSFGPANRRRPMGLDEVKLLVEWKLRHGTFRPKLMALVASNPPSEVQRCIQDALQAYEVSASTALKTLTTLRGIGPATASLLLAVHHQARAIFFSDEAFRWLCRGGDSRAPIRYTVAEYDVLCERAAVVASRLGVEPVELEKVAYVLMRSDAGLVRPSRKKEKVENEEKKEKKKTLVEKRASSPVDMASELRRSKRLKGTAKAN